MRFSKVFYVAALAVAPGFCLAQQASLTLPSNFANSATDTAASSTASPAAVVASGQQNSTLSAGDSKLDRWIDVKELSFSGRYRSEVGTGGGFRSFDNGQQRSVVDGGFKFDGDGKYQVRFHVSSGRTFNWSFSDQIGLDYAERAANGASTLTPAELQGFLAAIAADPNGLTLASSTPSRGFEMYFRQLYVSASPISQITFEFGSLGIEKGVSTEATTYDDDGYISGERLRFKDSKHLYFDEVALTSAYEGDILKPNFFSRGQSLTEANYRQFLVTKHFGDRVTTSADYTYDKGTHTLREAALVKVAESKILDSIRGEFYERLNEHSLTGASYSAAQGLALTGSKTFVKKLQLDGGFANIDSGYGVLTGSRLLAYSGFSMNGDAFLVGKRGFARANLKVTPYITVFGYFTRQFGWKAGDPIGLNKEAYTGGMTIDLKTLFTKARVL